MSESKFTPEFIQSQRDSLIFTISRKDYFEALDEIERLQKENEGLRDGIGFLHKKFCPDIE
jgi:hypothetical protein